MYAAKLGKSIEMEKRKGGGKYEELPLLECSYFTSWVLLEYLTLDSECLCQFPDITFVKLEVHLAAWYTSISGWM